MATFGWLPIAVAMGQPPGTDPPPAFFQSDNKPGEADLPVRAFLFRSESGNKVVMPGLTWQELQRLLDLDQGVDRADPAITLDSLEIDAVAEGVRAELKMRLRLRVDDTRDRWVSLPIRMKNFHLLKPEKMVGLDGVAASAKSPEAIVKVGGDGYVLSVRSKRAARFDLLLEMSARVEPVPTPSIEFSLPDVPARVALTLDRSEFDEPPTAEVIGRGDETLTTTDTAAGRQFLVESGGDNFRLRWGNFESGDQASRFLDVESEIVLDWDSPEDQPVASVKQMIENTNGSVDYFDVEFPPDSIVMDLPRIGGSVQTIDIPRVNTSTGNNVRRIEVPPRLRQQRIVLNYNLRLPAGGASEKNAYALAIPQVVGALRHRGTIAIRTRPESRLRWRAGSYVRAQLGEAPADSSKRRSYLFQFDRGSVVLPIWLVAGERQFRIVSKSELTIRGDSAELIKRIELTGQPPEGRLLFDDAGWQLVAINSSHDGLGVPVGTRSPTDGQPLDTFLSDGQRVIEVPPSTAETRILTIVAIREIDADSQSPAATMLDLPIPTLNNPIETTVYTSTLDVIGAGRKVFVADLGQCRLLSRIAAPSATATRPTRVALGPNLTSTPNASEASLPTRFRLLAGKQAPRLIGSLVEQPPRMTLGVSGRVELDGERLDASLRWSIRSPIDLEGRLTIRMPVQESEAKEVGTDNDRSLSRDPSWNVFVDDSPAILRQRDRGDFELISDRLTSGDMEIRFIRSDRIGAIGSTPQSRLLCLPRPGMADVTIEGPVRIGLSGSPKLSLTSSESGPDGILSMDTLPSTPLRLKIDRIESMVERLDIRGAVLRSTIGDDVREEQVIVHFAGGDLIEIGLVDVSDEFNDGSTESDRPDDPSGDPAEGPDPAETVDENSIVRLGDEQTGDGSVGADRLGEGRFVIEATIDGEPVRVRRRGSSLVVPLPGDDAIHSLDVRGWFRTAAQGAAAVVKPRFRLPLIAGRVYWQIVTPQDSHVMWASPTMGRSMAWRFDRWRLHRQTTHSDLTLAQTVGGLPSSIAPGHRYLYVGVDQSSFRVVAMTRTLLWALVASITLIATAMLIYVPTLRHPLTMAIVALLMAGLVTLAPDAAVILGQSLLLASLLGVLVVVVRRLISSPTSNRVFDPPPPSSPAIGSILTQTFTPGGTDQAGDSAGSFSAASEAAVPGGKTSELSP